MGKDKGTTISNTTAERTPTAEETRLNQLDIQLREATQPGLISTQTAGLDLAGKMLRGEQLPEGYQSLWAGIDEGVTSSIVGQSLRDIAPGFQAGGILDSGVAADISARTAADIRRASAEFNIGTKLNLLNLALSGQAQVQSPVLTQAANLGQRLGTLGKVTTSGSTNTYAMNPFLKSFQTSFGSALGSGNFGSENAKAFAMMA
jgi:hypothetical protein